MTVHGEQGYSELMRVRKELATKKERQAMEERAAKAEKAVKKADDLKVRS